MNLLYIISIIFMPFITISILLYFIYYIYFNLRSQYNLLLQQNIRLNNQNNTETQYVDNPLYYSSDEEIDRIELKIISDPENDISDVELGVLD